MLQWMHDRTVTEKLQADFASKTLEDCCRFIHASQDSSSDLHLAIADDADTYMGTVSLKHIDHANATAEFAITVRAAAMGKGYSRFGMAAILDMGLQELGLSAIYWCVSRENLRAVRFYDKNGYCRTQHVPSTITAHYTPTQLQDFYWYVVAKPNV